MNTADQRRAQIQWKYLLLLISIFFLCLSKIWEQDIFWLIRDGEYILKSLSFPRFDQWSYTAEGKPWVNVYWLSSILFYLVSQAGAVGLVILRGVLAVVLIGFCLELFPKSFRENRILLFCVLPIFYLAIAYKVQIRPDFIIFILFAGLRLVWKSDIAENHKAVLTALIILLGTNFHQGAAPMLVALGMLEVCKCQFTYAKIFALCLLFTAIYFMTPNGFSILPSMTEVLSPAHRPAIANPDYDSYGLDSFDFVNRGWSGICIIFLSFVCWWGFLLQAMEKIDRKLIFEACLLITLNLLSFYMERAFPFFLISILPYSKNLLGPLSEKNPRYSTMAIGIIWGFVIPAHIYNFKDHYGLGVDEKVYPIKSVDFIRANHPMKNIYHTPSYGNYLINDLKEYKVFADPREVIYKDIDEEFAQAFHSPPKTLALLDKFSINTVLLPQHRIVMNASGGYWDRLREFFPTPNWALVYYDEISMVLVRRLPEHSEIIRKYEYRELQLNLPPEVQIKTFAGDSQKLKILRDEAERCTNEIQDQWICSELLEELTHQ